MGGMNLITGITADNDCFERVEKISLRVIRKFLNASASSNGDISILFFFSFLFVEIAVRELFRPICMNRIYMKSLSRFIFRVAMEEITATHQSSFCGIIVPRDVTLHRLNGEGTVCRNFI